MGDSYNGCDPYVLINQSITMPPKPPNDDLNEIKSNGGNYGNPEISLTHDPLLNRNRIYFFCTDITINTRIYKIHNRIVNFPYRDGHERKNFQT